MIAQCSHRILLRRALAPLVVLLLALLPPVSGAQSDRGHISGTVHDSTGLAIADARIIATNTLTGVKSVGASSDEGIFDLPNLPLGNYDVSCDLEGFTHYVQRGVRVDLGRTSAVAIVLQVGSAQETVSVVAKTEVLDTQTSDVGDSVPAAQIINLPMPLLGDMRNPVDFLSLTPGVSTATPGDTSGSECFQCTLRTFHFSGGPSAAFEVYIDGIPVSNPSFSGDIDTSHPSIEAIGEFRSIDANPPAQYGDASGLALFTLKSGTNTYHGDMYEFLQNDHLDAIDIVSKDLGEKKAPYKQNEYGFTLGGPVRIPWLYNGKDKTFFFVSWTGFAFRPSANAADLTTFPNAFRTGDFSSLLGPQVTVPDPSNPNQQDPLYDPAGKPVYSGAIYDPTSAHTVTGPDGNSYVIRNAFPGNMISQSQMNSAALQILPYFPTATNNGLTNNYERELRTKTDANRTTVKIDQYMGQKQHLSGSLDLGSDIDSNNGGLSIWEASQSNSPSGALRGSYNFAFSPTLMNTFSVGLLRDKYISGPVQSSPALSALGLSGISQPADAGLPGFNVYGLNGLGGTSLSAAIQNRFLFLDAVNWQKGRHEFTFGGEVRKVESNEIPNTSGTFVFTQPQTALNGTGFVNGNKAVGIPNSATGSGPASFLMGAVNNSLYNTAAGSQYYRWSVYSGYAQDDWKVRNNFTLNVGLRYDVDVPLAEKNGDISSVDPTTPNPAASGFPGAYVFFGQGTGRNGRNRYTGIDFDGIQPRFGFAYSPNGGPLARIWGHNATVIRGGYSIIRPLANLNTEGGVGSNNYAAGFTGVANPVSKSDTVGSPAFYLNQPYPSFQAPPFIDPTLLVTQEPTWVPKNAGEPPTQENWSIEVQRELPRRLVVSAAYVGLHIYHVGLWAKPNQIDPYSVGQYASDAAADGLTLNSFFALPISDPRAAAAGINAPFANFQSLWGGGDSIGQSLRPFPQYGGINEIDMPIGSDHYHGLQARVQQNFSNGLNFLLSYTFSKEIGDADSAQIPTASGQTGLFTSGFQQNFYNQKAEQTVTSSNIPQQLAISYTYELPLGPGKKFLTSGGASGLIVGGWSISGIQRYQTGRPLHLEYDQTGPNNTYGAADGYSFTPDLVPGKPVVNPGFSKGCAGPLTVGRRPCQFYINPDAFTEQPTGEFGTDPEYLSSLHDFNFYDEDLSITKKTKIWEGMDVQFQANAFDAFNRVIWGINNGAVQYNYAPSSLESSTLQSYPFGFGIPTYQQNSPRRIQFALKVDF